MTSSYYNDLTYPYPPHIQKRLDSCLSFGVTGIIEILSSGYVQKSPHPQASPYSQDIMRKQLFREYEVYQRLPRKHDRLVRMIDFSENSTLKLEYLPLGNLRDYLRSYKAVIRPLQRLQWCMDAAEAVALVHSYRIIHCDIKPENFLLDADLRLRIIDFSGSSIDRKPPFVLESARFFLPRSRYDEFPCSVTTDLFALGSSIYEILTGSQPYANLEDEEVETRYKRQEFPTVNGLSCGEIVKKCWSCEFNSAEAVQVALEMEMQKYILPTTPPPQPDLLRPNSISTAKGVVNY